MNKQTAFVKVVDEDSTHYAKSFKGGADIPLEELENRYILDEKQMQELKAKVASEAFTAGETYGRDQKNVLKSGGQIFPDKTKYLNSIK